MAHLHTEPGQHDHTTCAFIVRLDRGEPKILLHAHKKLGKLLPFGGHIELDETPWESISHELREESGYDIDQLKILQPKDRIKKLTGVKLHPYPVCYNTHNFDRDHLHTDIGYAFSTIEDPRYALAPGESEKIIEIKQSKLISYSSNEMSENIKEICNFIFDTVLNKWEPISTKNYL